MLLEFASILNKHCEFLNKLLKAFKKNCLLYFKSFLRPQKKLKHFLKENPSRCNKFHEQLNLRTSRRAFSNEAERKICGKFSFSHFSTNDLKVKICFVVFNIYTWLTCYDCFLRCCASTVMNGDTARKATKQIQRNKSLMLWSLL
jgi:hypothetical protein